MASKPSPGTGPRRCGRDGTARRSRRTTRGAGQLESARRSRRVRGSRGPRLVGEQIDFMFVGSIGRRHCEPVAPGTRQQTRGRDSHPARTGGPDRPSPAVRTRALRGPRAAIRRHLHLGVCRAAATDPDLTTTTSPRAIARHWGPVIRPGGGGSPRSLAGSPRRVPASARRRDRHRHARDRRARALAAPPGHGLDPSQGMLDLAARRGGRPARRGDPAARSSWSAAMPPSCPPSPACSTWSCRRSCSSSLDAGRRRCARPAASCARAAVRVGRVARGRRALPRRPGRRRGPRRVTASIRRSPTPAGASRRRAEAAAAATRRAGFSDVLAHEAELVAHLDAPSAYLRVLHRVRRGERCSRSSSAASGTRLVRDLGARLRSCRRTS